MPEKKKVKLVLCAAAAASVAAFACLLSGTPAHDGGDPGTAAEDGIREEDALMEGQKEDRAVKADWLSLEPEDNCGFKVLDEGVHENGDGGYVHVLVLRNGSGRDCSITTSSRVDGTTDFVSAIELAVPDGEEAVLREEYDPGEGTDGVPSFSPGYSSREGIAPFPEGGREVSIDGYLECQWEDTGGGVEFTVKNSGVYIPEFVGVSAVFFSGGKIVDSGTAGAVYDDAESAPYGYAVMPGAVSEKGTIGTSHGYDAVDVYVHGYAMDTSFLQDGDQPPE